MKCPNCSKKISKDSLFCEFCGTKISESKSKTADEVDFIFSKALSHLEFLGYEIESKKVEDGMNSCSAKHQSRSNLIIRFYPTSGFNIQAGYRFDADKIMKNKLDFLEAINKLNNTSTLTCFALTGEDSSISCYSWYPPDYNKSKFGYFIERFETDISKGFASLDIEKYT